MANEHFLITGAYGCLGSWAVKQLVDSGTPVATYDLPGDPHRLKTLLSEDELARVHPIDGDITDLASFEQAITANGITHIVHLAALQVPFVRADPVKGMHVNVVGTTVVFETMKRCAGQLRGLSWASSVGVLGDTSMYPDGVVANDAPLAPPTLYGVSKQANEGSARIFFDENQVQSIGLRPYVVYGPGRDQGWTSTPTKAMLAAVAGRPYHIGFGGTIMYHHASEAADMFIRAARASSGVGGAPVFNLTGVAAHMSEIVSAVEAAVPEAAGTITFDDVSLPHPGRLDSGALEQIVGPCPVQSIADGVRTTVAQFRDAIANERLDLERALA